MRVSKPRIALIPFLLLVGLGCSDREVVDEYKARWIRLRHEPIEEARVGNDAPVYVEVTASPDVSDQEVFLYYGTEPAEYELVRMKPLEEGRYFGMIPALSRATLVHYYVEARAGTDLVARVPSDTDEEAFVFYFKGIPNRKILVAHVVLMFVSLFIFIFAGYLAVKAIKDRRIVLHIPRLSFLGVVIFFVSSFPLGMVVAYQTYGTPWSGFPIGTDITDNKSLGIVAYWAAATFFYRGSVFRKDPNGDLFSMTTLPYVYLVGVIVTIALFLIPH
jgi:hypothetical protein